MNNTKIKLFLCAFTVFSASAALMIVEIVAARLLAPYVGVSLYTWTTLIGVILAGLSLGNWLGGFWVDRGADAREAGITLFLSGIFCLISLLILTWLAPLLQAYRANLILSSMVYVSALFFIPALLLGIVTPLLTALALNLDKRTGHVLGRMHALAALGSIVGTFVAGFWLIQFFGTRSVIIGTAVGLILLSLPWLMASKKTMLGMSVVAVLGLSVTAIQGGLETPCDAESNYLCIRVVDESTPASLGPVRSMVLDHLSHGTNVRDDTELLLAPYVQAMDELVYQQFQGNRNLTYFFAGGGAYTQPRALRSAAPQAEIHVAELDPLVTQVAEQHLFFDSEGVVIHHRDARPVLQEYPESYFDVVVGDVFHDIAIPYHLVTLEFLQLVKNRMKPDGLYLMNVVDTFPDPRMVKSLLKTLQSLFSDVRVWVDHFPDRPERMTYVISAGDQHDVPEILVAQTGMRRRWMSINEPLLQSGTGLAELPILTDGFAPVDRLLSSLLLSDLGL